MSSIAVQTAVGEIGSKATTELDYSFGSMITLGNRQIGANSNGLFLLNTTDEDAGEPFSRTVTLATTDLNIHNMKRARFLYIGIDTDNDFTLSIKLDKQDWQDYSVSPLKTGLQIIKVSMHCRGQNAESATRKSFGRDITIKITSDYWFRLDSINGSFIGRSSGVGGY